MSMADAQEILARGRRVRTRTQATLDRARQLVNSSRELIESAQREERSTLELLDTLSEVHGFIEVNRRDLHRSMGERKRRAL